MTKGDLRIIKEVRDVATMQRAGFAMPHEFVQTCGASGKAVGEPVHVTEFIREQTRIWRETWIVNPLSELIERREQEANRHA